MRVVLLVLGQLDASVALLGKVDQIPLMGVKNIDGHQILSTLYIYKCRHTNFFALSEVAEFYSAHIVSHHVETIGDCMAHQMRQSHFDLRLVLIQVLDVFECFGDVDVLDAKSGRIGSIYTKKVGFQIRKQVLPS